MEKTILVADDHPEQVEDMIIELRGRYNVEYVGNGKAAVERIQKGGLDAAILDWDMACYDDADLFDGDTVAKTARELHPNLVLVLRSSNADRFEEELEPLGIYCHPKQYGDRRLYAYLNEKLGGV